MTRVSDCRSGVWSHSAMVTQSQRGRHQQTANGSNDVKDFQVNLPPHLVLNFYQKGNSEVTYHMVQWWLKGAARGATVKVTHQEFPNLFCTLGKWFLRWKLHRTQLTRFKQTLQVTLECICKYLLLLSVLLQLLARVRLLDAQTTQWSHWTY